MKKGFTLIELLVVVLIIGVLSAIALSKYNKVVERTKSREALLVMNAVVKGEHNNSLLTNAYTTDFKNLDIGFINNAGNDVEGSNYSTDSFNFTLKDKVVLGSRNTNSYFLIQDYKTSTVMCSPDSHFICQDFAPVTQASCKDAGLYWANGTIRCYESDKSRCADLNLPWNSHNFCGWYDGHDITIPEGAKCVKNSIGSVGCDNITIENGGLARCTFYGCKNTVVKKGGVAVCNYNACPDIKIEAGGKCVAKGHTACQAHRTTYLPATDTEPAGCCVPCGGTCPSNKICNLTAEELEEYCNL